MLVFTLEQEKSLEKTQGITDDRTSGGEGVLQLEAEGSTKPVVNLTTFEQTVTSHPTSSYPYLHFNTNYEPVQRRQSQYHPITPIDLKRMNQYAASIQKTAQWYLDELAGHHLHYFYSDKGETNLLTVSFKQENFLHLTGIRPVVEGRQAADFVMDFVQGKGNYNQILVSNSLKEKLQVLPMLEDIIDSNSFVLDNLEEVRIAQRLNFSEAIKSKDEDFLLLFKDIGDERVPASLMKIKGDIATDLKKTEDKTVLGVYRERDGQITQRSINEVYIRDGGSEMMAIMEGNLKETRLNRYETIEAERQLDSDGDGISNEDEIRLGTDPYNASSRPGREKDDHQTKRIDMTTVSDLLAANDTKGLSQHLRDGMRQYLDSDQYRTFLSAMSKFHNYSPQNIALLLAQNPKITAVASYQKWQKAFGRQVQKGEKGLKIRVPMTFTLKDENGQPKLDEQGKEVTVTRFKLGTVFDVSQTQGKPLPRPIYNLENDVLDYDNLYRAARHVSEQNGVPISFEKIEDSKANGFFDLMNKRIVLADKQMSEAQIMKTLFHEMAHSDLHKHAITESQSDYATGELQAESIAYVVASHYGIDTSDYT